MQLHNENSLESFELAVALIVSMAVGQPNLK